MIPNAISLSVLLLIPQILAAAVFTVTSPDNSGSGTLREALLQANATPNGSGNDRIEFALPETGSHSIALFSELPSILDPVDIDGTTQPGYSGRPLVELNGANAGANSSGLVLLTSNCTVRGLVINRFRDFGILLNEFGGHVVQGNYIGIDTSGTTAQPNNNAGLVVRRSGNNLIGGTHDTDRNVISGNAGTGIYLLEPASRSNRVEGNFIGTTATGTAALGNGTNGIVINNAPFNTIGGTATGAGNVISGNERSGIAILDVFGAAAGNVIQGNRIGTDVSGANAVPNTADGITLFRAPNTQIGGTNDGAGNLISGNGERGILVLGPGGQNNVIQGNRIGTDALGSQAIGNTYSGIGLSGVSSNCIGGTTAAARNIIAGNQQSGVQITGSGSSGNRVEGNYLGVDITGTHLLGNQFNGVTIEDASANTIGGLAPGARNIISGNNGHGIYVAGAEAEENVIQGNYIGTDAAGTTALRNDLTGVRLEAPGNQVGGPGSAARNVISGNTLEGVFLVGAQANDNTVQGNFIGTDSTGTQALGNGRAGIGLSGAPNNQIGGATPELGNVISANGDAGIFAITESAHDNRIEGNRIGTDASGTVALGNFREGIYLDRAGTNVIGGATADLGNLISANRLRGIRLTNSWWNVIENNVLGAAIDGNTDLGNGQHTIELEEGSSHNVIGGGTGRGNVIANAKTSGGFGMAGIRLRDQCANNLMLNNSIFDNAGLGIDISNYLVTRNDGCDADGGANRRQNFPDLNAVFSGSGIYLEGQLTSVANRTYRIQFFASPNCDPRNYGEGKIFLGETMVTTGTDCTGAFALSLPGSIPAGYAITATATDPDNNTSEFSQCVPTSDASLVQTQTAPGQLQLSWPVAATAFQLQQTDSLTPPIQWLPVTNPPIVPSNGQNTVTLGTTNGPRFFRLAFESSP